MQKLKLTVGKAIDHLGYGKFQYLMLFICGYSQITTSAEVMILSFLMPELRQFYDLHGGESALLGFVVIIGKLVGATVCGWVSDRIGRRPSTWC